MKKTLIGSLVGAVILFLWQFVSWTAAELHRPAQAYTPKQDSILQYLSTQFTEDGTYFLPTYPDGASMEEQQKTGRRMCRKAMGADCLSQIDGHEYGDEYGQRAGH